MKQEFQCSICRGRFSGYGHNGQPLVRGKVCDVCNSFVIHTRIQQLMGGKK